MSVSGPVLRSQRLILRPVAATDRPAMVALFADPEVMRFSDHGPRAATWVDGWLRDASRTGAVFAVREQNEEAVLGYCGLFGYPDDPGRIALGVRLVPGAWGRGLAGEATRAVLGYAHRSLGLARVVALVDPSNTRSVRLVERLGLTHERDVRLPGYDHPDRLYVSAPPT